LWYLWQTGYLHELLSLCPRHLKSTWVLLACFTLLFLHGKIVYRYERMESIDGVGPNLHSFGGWRVQSVPTRCRVPALVEIEYASLLLDFWSVVRISPFSAPDCTLIVL
jgi:hypothetical protein